MKPFEIHVADTVLDDLRERLARTRWPALEGETGWAWGADLEEIKALCAYWRDGFDWRAQEATLNAWAQFIIPVDGVDLHVFHVKSPKAGAQPLLLLHGWPGSVFEFADLIGPLTDPDAHGAPDASAFDVVIPAIPGFGFSGKPSEPGWGPARVAKAFDTLMTEALGYSSYLVQGGDWGAIIGRRMAQNHAANIRALHLNTPYATPLPDDPPDAQWNAMRDTGLTYLMLQRLQPDVIAPSMADSPAGLAAWVLEKFHAWGGSEGALDTAFTRDQLLTNLMFYWAPNAAGSAARLYREAGLEGVNPWGAPKVEVPTAFAVFPKEPFRAPRAWLERIYAVVRYTEMPAGGHFPGLEQPALLLEDVRAFFADYG